MQSEPFVGDRADVFWVRLADRPVDRGRVYCVLYRRRIDGPGILYKQEKIVGIHLSAQE